MTFLAYAYFISYLSTGIGYRGFTGTNGYIGQKGVRGDKGEKGDTVGM